MPSSKGRQRAPTTQPPQVAEPKITKTPFRIPETVPLSSYISLVGVHSTLWAFAALFFPRTTFLAEFTKPDWDPTQLSSQDRPQHPFMEALTMNPTSTLGAICVGSIVLQVWWSGWLREWWLNLGIRGIGDERRAEKAFHDRQKMIVFRNAFMATVTASLAIHLLLILFGAPIMSLKAKTYLLAFLISVMVIYPPAYVLGVPSLGNGSTAVVRRYTWIRLFAELSPRNPVERALVYPMVGTCVGGWLGVIPIALDWDRPWQAWPLTPTFGAILGYIMASLAAVTITTFMQFREDQSRTQSAAAEEKTK